ncbi:MAG: undecaprenyl-diphosphate phosphatase [Streptosporangiales bacterium]|nr:undecaprenyl-diphosphate phosphatase [Streptosporangiales bacterium]MBO0890855.1 undecaprenyl-diphosphate phosphatase [Acidothermales bacterium]
MNLLHAIVLGIVQGLTEFLPISSTAHLLIVPKLLGWGDPGAAFSAVIQLGTMAAVVVFFWRDIVRIVWTWLRSLWTPALRGELDARMGWYIGLGTIPIGIIGLVFKDQIETAARNLWLTSTVLIVFAVVLLIADRVGRKTRPVERLTAKDAAVVGTFQILALIPGVSRSGSTITGGLFMGLNREAAARYSFLLSVPAVVLSGLFELKGAIGTGDVGWPPTLVATLFAFVVGYASIAWLLRFLVRHSTVVFVVYRVLLGATLLALLATGLLHD